jgi:type VI protein secretion system component VasK
MHLVVAAGSWVVLMAVTLTVAALTEVGPVVPVTGHHSVRLLECVVLCKGGFIASAVTAVCWVHWSAARRHQMLPSRAPGGEPGDRP